MGLLSAISVQYALRACLSNAAAKYPLTITIAISAPASAASLESRIDSLVLPAPVPAIMGTCAREGWAESRTRRAVRMRDCRSSDERWCPSPMEPLITSPTPAFAMRSTCVSNVDKSTKRVRKTHFNEFAFFYRVLQCRGERT